MPASPIRKLVPLANAAKRRGISIYHLNIGQPDILTPQEIVDAIKGYDDPVLRYGPADGISEFHDVLVEYFAGRGVNIRQEDLMITTGGSEAAIFAMLAVCDPGDEIVIPEPFYTNYAGFAVMSGINLVPVETRVEEGFHLPPPEEIESRVTSKTKAILICSPNNPTGTVYTREELERIARIAQASNLFVISDEVYREFVYDGKAHASMLHLEGMDEKTIIIDSISKRFSACGARIGYLLSRNREVMDTVLRFGQARLCPPTVEQRAAVAGYRAIDRFMSEMIAEWERRRDLIYEAVNKLPGAFCRKPEGAFYTVARLPVNDTEDFSRWLLEEFNVDGKTVMLAPAQGFYATKGKGKDEVRIAYVLQEEALADAMQILERAIEVYSGTVDVGERRASKG
ncbi:aspartate aminotransferase [candidate division TA06 bacterium DG_24]|uniref:Aminotransferase n=3 Tax=Bacteria division TA06 TaxID=1156500 RepID=A0A0S8JLJ0_UNCT6|nr:MAG: aspartate aminotransferase [candidate division TA06 bacterium DG_24]KPK69056.1 MAG: aspartate aminotransferase [candidate division TA06 bacterium SM23_40]KPL10520.1 MAG: aspartate aminotransferase [candidate division TA06 bacterium SM1_40]